MMIKPVFLLCIAVFAGCPPGPPAAVPTPDSDAWVDAVNDGSVGVDVRASDATAADAPGREPSGVQLDLWAVRACDTEASERGRAWLTEDPLVGGLVPPLALRHLYLTWPDSLLDKLGHYQDEAGYWAAFHQRYGTYPAPFPNNGLPLGMRSGTTGLVYFDCLLCHAGPSTRPDASPEAVIGAPNPTLQLQQLYDDLQALPAAVESFRAMPLPEPYATLIANAPLPDEVPELPGMTDRTGGPGLTDAFGLGMALSPGAEAAGIHTRYGYQDPAPWWLLKYKQRTYADGSGRVGGYRTMMATLLAYGDADLVTLDAAFEDVAAYLNCLPDPAATPAGEPVQVAGGEALYAVHCSSCHGGGSYPDLVVDVSEVGTDPVRTTRFGAAEAAHVNGLSLQAEHAMTPTAGYLAPPLVGVSHSAPYLHNGAAPTLEALLDPSLRPARAGEGLLTAGHDYAADLSPQERAQLLIYLNTL